jgi:hypothetical protein
MIRRDETHAPLPPYLAAFFASRPVKPAPRDEGLSPPRVVLAQFLWRGVQR